MGPRSMAAAVMLLALLPAAPREVRAGGVGRLAFDVITKDRVMSGIYKVYADPKGFPDQWLALATARNDGDGPLTELRVRFRFDGYTDWSTWSTPATCAPGATVEVPYHPVLDRRIVDLQSSTPVELKVEWECAGSGGAGTGAESRRVTFLGGHEFVFSSTPRGGPQTFAASNSNARFLAAWVSRDDPVIKQFAALASRNAGGVARVHGIEDGKELLRALYELFLLNDFVYKSGPALADPTLSFDNTTVQNVKYPRDVLRDKSGTCLELAILHAAVAHQLGIRPLLACVKGHCFPIFTLDEKDPKGEPIVRRVALEATGIRGGLRSLGMSRIGFDKAIDLATANETRSREANTFLEIDVRREWALGVGNPELPPLPEGVLETWGITAKGMPGITLPDIGGGATLSDASGFGGTWEGTVKARFGGPEMKPYVVTLVVVARRGERYKLLATFVPEGGGDTVQEESVAEDQDGQLVFQGKGRTVRSAAGTSTELAPGRGVAKVKDGKLVGKYGADGEGFSPFTLDRK